MDYNKLRRIIASCVEGSTRDPRFRLNIFKLTKKVKKLGLIPLTYKSNYESNMATADDIPFLMEICKEDRIEWFDSTKSFLTIQFVREQDLSDELYYRLERLLDAKEHKEARIYKNRPSSKNIIGRPVERDDTDDEAVDIVYALARIVGSYPVYTVVVGKWVKPDRVSLYIRIRANTILIQKDEDIRVDPEAEDTIFGDNDDEDSDDENDGSDENTDSSDGDDYTDLDDGSEDGSEDDSSDGDSEEEGNSESDSGSDGSEVESESDNEIADEDDTIIDESY